MPGTPGVDFGPPVRYPGFSATGRTAIDMNAIDVSPELRTRLDSDFGKFEELRGFL